MTYLLILMPIGVCDEKPPCFLTFTPGPLGAAWINKLDELRSSKKGEEDLVNATLQFASKRKDEDYDPNYILKTFRKYIPEGEIAQVGTFALATMPLLNTPVVVREYWTDVFQEDLEF